MMVVVIIIIIIIIVIKDLEENVFTQCQYGCFGSECNVKLPQFLYTL